MTQHDTSKTVIPVLLAGGSGTRLWPLSRKSNPKQFAAFHQDKSLFQMTALRFSNSQYIDYALPITITHSDFRFVSTSQLNDVGIDPGPILIEPMAKNTAPAILAASFHALQTDPEAILIVTPTDHLVDEPDTFNKAVSLGLEYLNDEQIVVFGIKPTHAETGYGYLETGNALSADVKEIMRFVEKPEKTHAEMMLAKGNYLWNAGIFLFRAKDMVTLFQKYSCDFVEPVRQSVLQAKADLGFLRLDKTFWSKLHSQSIDYAIMEQHNKMAGICYAGSWSDLGDWNAIWQNMPHDKDGVALSRNAHVLNCKNSLVRSESEHQHIVGIGLEDILAVAMPDAVLVCHKNHTQDVKKIVSELVSSDVRQSELSSKTYRPWGWYETLFDAPHFQVKSIMLLGGSSLTLHKHHHRSEHWVIVQGEAEVTIGDSVQTVIQGQSVCIPQGICHRLQNKNDNPTFIIEVQTGSYVGEEDIERM